MESPQPVDLQWAFGVSSDTRGGVVDLRTAVNRTVAYAAGHTLVIYDRSQHRQVFLQGHIHQIQCLSACPKKKFIISADCGPDAILIVWNRADGQSCLHINEDDQDEFVTNGKERVFFWRIFKDKEECREPVIKLEEATAKAVEVQQSVCDLTLSVFVPSSDSAITAMISGEVIVWQEPQSSFVKESPKAFPSLAVQEDSKKEPSARRMHAVKIVRLHHSAITFLSVQDNYIVTGGSDGYVRFYDPRLGLVGWLEELHAGEITSISFSAMDDYKQESTTINLQVPPFVVGTKKGHVLFLHAAIFDEQPGSLHCEGEEMMDYVPKMVKSVSTHPLLPHFAIINADGLFQVHDHSTRRICTQRDFSKLKAEAIAYSPSGLVIACGFLNGFLKIVESDALQDIESIAVSRSGITKLEFSSDETSLAIADASFAVSLLSCSITKDSMIVEYDLLESMKEKRLKLRGTWPLNAPGLPMALISTTAFKKGELHLLISDSSFKIRIYDTRNFACQKTFLGPTFGTPVNSMFRISHQDSLQALGSDPGTGGRLNLELFLTVMQTEGERMTREEILCCFERIIHKHDAFPREVSATWFGNELLKL